MGRLPKNPERVHQEKGLGNEFTTAPKKGQVDSGEGEVVV